MSLSTTAAAALTTPFSPPASCASNFITTSIVTSFWQNEYSTTTLRVLASNLYNDDSSAACQPDGWVQRPDTNARFEFSPAVCPSAWTAYYLGVGSAPLTTGADTTASKLVSTAYCCAGGFSYSSVDNFHVDGIDSTRACFQNIAAATATATSSAGPRSSSLGSVPFPNGLRVHNPWHISWEYTDIATLSPTPPRLADYGCSGEGVALTSWIPGQAVNTNLLNTARCTQTPSSNDGASSNGKGFAFVIIGLPIIGFVIIVVGITLCVRRHRKGTRLAAEEGPWRTPKGPSVAVTQTAEST